MNHMGLEKRIKNRFLCRSYVLTYKKSHLAVLSDGLLAEYPGLGFIQGTAYAVFKGIRAIYYVSPVWPSAQFNLIPNGQRGVYF
jgi:hypothetical protein